jgi:PadR family transcriptional regulator PadR
MPRRSWGCRDPCRYLPDYDNIVFFIMAQPGLGEFEQTVLLAVAHLRDEAYGIPIVKEIERRTGRSVARAAVYVTLRRLEEKGFVSSWMGDPTPERGGKSRRYAKLTAAGAGALREARRAAERMWQGLDPASLGSR